MLSKEKWATLAENAHLVVFNEARKPESERIDFALLVESEHGIPMQYVTVKELDQESLYFQYGGSFPGTKHTMQSFRCMEKILEWVKFMGYRRVNFLVENTNDAMMKLAMRCQFLITGIKNFKGHILLEHTREL
jgi:hypothetical protein